MRPNVHWVEGARGGRSLATSLNEVDRLAVKQRCSLLKSSPCKDESVQL